MIRGPITGGSGEISGGFTVAQANDLAVLLRAGALPAKLTIVEERTVGPGLGQDSINAGKTAFYVASVLVLTYMVTTYGIFGIFADVALAVHILLIFAAMVLYLFGSGPVRGFAVSLGLGILTSVVTAVTMTRMMIAVWYRAKRPNTLPI